MMATRALGLFSRIHLASSTITMLLPLPWVCQMMPPFLSRDMRLRGLDAEILVRARQLLHAAVEQHEVVHQLDQPVLAAHLEQVLVQLEAAVVRFVFLPLQEVLLRRADGAVPQPLGVVAGEDELHGGEEPLVELRLLVREALADAVADARRGCSSAPARRWRCHSHRARCRAAAHGCPLSVTSSAMAKSFCSGFCQLMSWTVSVTLPASVFTGTP